MREALEATKVLADDCRRNGTAFRLGVMILLLDVLSMLRAMELYKFLGVAVLEYQIKLSRLLYVQTVSYE